MESRLWRCMLAQYGQRVTLVRAGGEKEIRAFFQPVARQAPGETPTPLGVAPAGSYLYLGPVEEELEGVEELRWQGRSFRFLRHRGFPVGEDILYRWALAEEMDEVSP